VSTTRPVLLFDGVCNVCNASVQFVLKHERDGAIQFASLQSEAGRRLVEERALPDDVSTVIFLDGDKSYVRSSAAVAVLRHLRAPWSWLAPVLQVIPRPLRDLGYAIFARLRYRLFGKRETCMVPTPEIRARFLG
jgi:predicted DCC family thiol-disulfide oxidoreductase YuxK